MIFDTKLSGHAVVVSFFKTYPDLTRLHREVKVEGYTPVPDHWWSEYDTGKSLFMFEVEHPVRQLCGRVVSNEAFDKFILFCIAGGTIIMALDTDDQHGKVSSTFAFIDLMTNIIFTLEMCMRIVWMGFYMSETAYLSDSWFQLDFAIVLAGWLSMIDGFPNFKSFRGFRALRAIKGVRFLSYCSAVLDSLFAAMPLFADVISVTLFLMLVFGIMAVQIFAGSLRRTCQSIAEPGTPMVPETSCGSDLYGNNKDTNKLYSDIGYTCPPGFDCILGENPDEGFTSFDNLGISIFTIFQMMTLEGWTGIMYMAQYAESNYSSWYFVIVILLFGFIVVNLYIAVIVQTFAIIRRKNDKAARMELVADGKLILNEDGTFSEVEANPILDVTPTVAPTLDNSNTGQIMSFLTSLQLEQYSDGILTLVDNPDEIWLLSQEDLASIGMKLVHIRRLMEATKAPPAFHDPLMLASVGPLAADVPMGKTSAEVQYAFLRSHNLEQYHSKLIKLCDSLDELSKLNQSDFEYAGLKLHHARELVMRLEDRRIAMPQEGEELLNPALIKLLDGESVGMWRSRVMRSSPFWRTWFGEQLLLIWYRMDPQVDLEDPPGYPTVPRTKFIDPYQWDTPSGRVLSSTPWEVFISFAICVNIITMSMNYHGASDEFRFQLKIYEVCFTCIFLGEMILKFVAMGGLKYYFAEPFNQFDFVLVTTSIPSAVATLAGTEPFLNLSMLRVLKMLRMLKLLSKTRQLLYVVAQAAKPIGNLTLFIFFSMSIFAICGMALFEGLMCDVNFDPDTEVCPELPRVTFDSFMKSLYVLFQVMTGEDWNAIMRNALRQSPIFAGIYFVVFFILLNYILMEMFCAVILENFQLRAEERKELQVELLSVKKAKMAAAKSLAEGVDRELAQIRMKEEAEAAENAIKDREQKIRQQNEAKRLGVPVTEESAASMSSEEQEKRKAFKEQRDAELKQQISDSLKGKQETTIEMSENFETYVGEEFIEDQPGNSNSMIVDALKDKADEKVKKNQKVVVVVEHSCMYFSQDHEFREMCFKLVQNPWFDFAMFTTICVSSIVLALDTPYKQNTVITDLIAIADPTILGIFSVEFAIRVVGQGFSGKESAYINDPWNRLDFFVLAFSWICVVATEIPSAFARTIRIGRAIRPLRMVNQNERIQIVFNALFMAMPDILNVCFLLVFMMFMFSVMGMGFFMGLFFTCNDDSVAGLTTCKGTFASDDGYITPRVWDNPNYSFDTVMDGILCLYEVSSLEGWPDILYSTTDVVGLNQQPQPDNQSFMTWYLVVFICVGPFFVLNLVVGVIIEKFNQISGRGLLTDEQRMFKDTLLQAMLHDDSAPLERPPGLLRGTCYAICQNENFEGLILFLVIVNAMLMGTERYDQPEEWTSMLFTLNLVFVVCFTLEMMIKVTGLGMSAYFNDGWNCMDFVIVIGCLIMVPLDGIVNLQALRPFRLFMIFRMIRRARGIRLMVCTLLMSLPALFNVASLLFLAFFIFAVLGMSQFANIKFGEHLTTQANFRYFDSSLLLLTRMVTGEAWNSIMHDCMVQPPTCTNFYGSTTNGIGDLDVVDARTSITNVLWPYTSSSLSVTAEYWLPNDCGGGLAVILYFVMFQLIGNYMVVNLFVAVILDNYAFMANVGDAEISEFVLTKFRKSWYLITLKDKHVNQHLGKYMRIGKTREFLTKLGAPLGVVLWDVAGVCKFKTIQDEVRRLATPGLGISYRKMQYILCIHAMSKDINCEMPLDEYEAREDALINISKTRCASMLTAAFKGKQGRKNLGVVEGQAKSADEEKADSFKKRFANLMSNPAKSLSPVKSPTPSAAMSVTSPTQVVATIASPGVQPTSPPVSDGEAAATAEVRNVFRERAAQRAAAKAAKPS